MSLIELCTDTVRRAHHLRAGMKFNFGGIGEESKEVVWDGEMCEGIVIPVISPGRYCFSDAMMRLQGVGRPMAKGNWECIFGGCGDYSACGVRDWFGSCSADKRANGHAFWGFGLVGDKSLS